MKTLRFLLPGPRPRARQPLTLSIRAGESPANPPKPVSPARIVTVDLQEPFKEHYGTNDEQKQINNPLFPAHGPSTGSNNGLHPKSKFLAIAAR